MATYSETTMVMAEPRHTRTCVLMPGALVVVLAVQADDGAHEGCHQEAQEDRALVPGGRRGEKRAEPVSKHATRLRS